MQMANINDDGFLELSGVNEKAFKDTLNAEKFPILSGLSPLNLRVLNQASHTLHVSQGVEMMHEGNTPHDIYFISKGSVSIVKKQTRKAEVVAKLIAGNFYGEYSALRKKKSFASVYTAEPSEIVRVDIKAIQQVFDADEEFRKRIHAVMQERMLNSFLFSHPVFKKLSSASRDMLTKQLEVIELDKDEMLFKYGDKAANYYLIISGEAEITVMLNDVPTVLEVRRENGVLGEVRVENGQKYAYGVYAANSLDLLLLDKAALQTIQKADPEAISLLNQMMSHSAKKTSMLMKKVLGEAQS
jgi:CRP-like cAMP-binding protein